MIFAAIGVGALAFISIFCASMCDKVWFKLAVSLTLATLIAFLVEQTWI